VDKKDEDCDGQANEGCTCVNGTSVPCDCGGIQLCTNGVLGACSKAKTTFYRDFDQDTYGDPRNTASACTAPAGYVANSGDCDDTNGTIVPGYTTCSANDRRYCDTDGVMKTEPCNDGCYEGVCRKDGTIGVAGMVACAGAGYPQGVRCSTSIGCGIRTSDSSIVCSPVFGTHDIQMYCDGPNDCGSGQVCCKSVSGMLGVKYGCYDSSCPPQGGLGTVYIQICDPLQDTCTGDKHCQTGDSYYPHECVPN
jgi:hypothetical protein